MKDFRRGQKVIATIILEDQGQDFTELDILENGVILGNSCMFKNGCLSLLGIGTLNGQDYWDFKELKEDFADRLLANFYIYMKETETKDPLPWKAITLNYKIIDVKKAIKPNRFKQKKVVN